MKNRGFVELIVDTEGSSLSPSEAFARLPGRHFASGHYVSESQIVLMLGRTHGLSDNFFAELRKKSEGPDYIEIDGCFYYDVVGTLNWMFEVGIAVMVDETDDDTKES